ncbi:MAG TPA: DUF424 family protein [Candidatus Methanomethylophilaceae archaeon]|nr:DUF424 family protein [Candidatus Methanomethylophilaceae archaeon]
MIRARIHKHGDERLLAACDEELLGRTFSEGVVKVTISENFYGMDTMTEETLGERMGSVTIMNLFGERTIAVGIEKGFVEPENVLIVAGIKHAQVVLL